MTYRSSAVAVLSTLVLTLLAAGSAGAQVTAGAPHPGQIVYERSCAACHQADSRGPALSRLQSMNAADLLHALTRGIMAQQGSALSEEERTAVIQYLAAVDVQHDSWISNMMCSVERRDIDLGQSPSMGRLHVDFEGTRMMSAEEAGLSRADLGDLELAWAIAFPGVTLLRSSPVIVGNTMFYSATSTRMIMALDAETGCVKWVHDAEAALRSSLTMGEVGDGRQALFFTDGRAQVHAVDAATGERIWVVDGQADPGQGMLTGAPAVYDGKVIVPVSASGVTAAANPNFECCVGRGAVLALDARTGERLWTYFTMEEAEYTGAVNSAGARLRGPSGAPIWSSPTIDVDRRRVYATTGQNTSLPATGTSNAIIALDFDTGEELWVFQGTPDDVWSMACSSARPGPNCPSPDDSILEDWDFGSSAVRVSLADGRELLLAGQKSGHLWALNADDGSLVWKQRVGVGGPLGGNHWGIAVDGERVYLPISDPFPNGQQRSGMYAFDIATGDPVWEHPLTADCSPGREEFIPQCSRQYGLSAMPLVVDGAVVTGGLDGRVHIFDGSDGRVLFQFDTARRFEGINGVEGHGGAIDSHSIAAGAGMVYIASGYAFFSQPGGNVLLAFRPRQ